MIVKVVTPVIGNEVVQVHAEVTLPRRQLPAVKISREAIPAVDFLRRTKQPTKQSVNLHLNSSRTRPVPSILLGYAPDAATSFLIAMRMTALVVSFPCSAFSCALALRRADLSSGVRLIPTRVAVSLTMPQPYHGIRKV
jgi:hypothetical protein